DYLEERPTLPRLIKRAGLDDSRYLRTTIGKLLRPLWSQGLNALEAGPWDASELPHVGLGLYHLIFGYFADATLFEVLAQHDPRSPAAVARQRRFVKAALALRLDQIDLANPDTFVAGWPHDAFALLRREAPVYWHPGGGAAGGFWVVSKYRDVMAAQLDSKTFSSARGGTILREFEGEELEANRAIMLNMDAPRHTRFRRLVNLGFSPKVTNRMTTQIRETAARI